MKTTIVTLLTALILPFFAQSQVGIGTTTPDAQLDIAASNTATPSNTDGILIPKIDEFPVTNPTAAQDGMMVYATGNGGVSKGFYYWNNNSSSWVTIIGSVNSIQKIDDLTDGKSDTAGSSLFIGEGAGLNASGSNGKNIGVGYQSLSNILDSFPNGDRNVGVGWRAGYSLTSGRRNVAIGHEALYSNTLGSSNVALGNNSLHQNISGTSNIAVGNNALFSGTGINNIGIGLNAGYWNSGNRNVFIGYGAGFLETGSEKLYIENGPTYGDEFTCLIYGEFDNNLLRINGELQIGNQSTTGYSFPSTRGNPNQVIQTDGAGNLTWVDATSFGAEQIDELLDGKSDGSSIFLGINAGANDNGTNNYNIGIGLDALNSNISGYSNIAIGRNALLNNTTGHSNLSIGSYSMFNNSSGNYNTVYGQSAMSQNSTGYGNTAIGDSTLNQNTTGYRNVALGYWALQYNTTGPNNIGIGFRSLGSNTSGHGNVAIGYSAHFSNTIGNRNVAIGESAGGGSGDFNIFLGYLSGSGETGSNRLYIESSSADSNNALIYGEFDNDILRTNGTFQVGNPSVTGYAFPAIDGTTNQVLQTDGNGNVTWSNISDQTSASNGITEIGNDIQLGGILTQNTTITQGTNNLIFNLDSSGDFVVQDNGANHFEIRDNGNSYFGGASSWYQGDISGTQIASLLSIANSGAFFINNNGSAQHFIYGAGTTVFNALNMDADFQINGDIVSNLFYVDASTNRIGIRDAAPTFDLQVKQSDLTEGGAGGIGLESSSSANNWKIYHSGTHFSFAENGVRRAYVTGGTGAYVQVSDRNFKKNITKVEAVLPKLSLIDIYKYHYKDQNPSEAKTIGVMAQEIKTQFPELVSTSEDGTLGMNYSGLSVVAIKAIKEQQQLINAQRKEIESLKKDISDIKELLRQH